MDWEISTELGLKAGGSLPADRAAEDVVGRSPDRRMPVRPRRLARRRQGPRGDIDTGGAKDPPVAHRTGDRRIPLSRVGPSLDERWNSLLECTPDLVVVVDGDGLISHANYMSAKLAGGREGVVGRSIYDFLAPEYRARVRESIESVFQTGKTFWQVVSLSTPGGTAFWSQACIGPITENGRIVDVGVFFADITEREKLETRLRESEMLLRSIVKTLPKMVAIMDGLVHHGVNIADPRQREQELELHREQMIQMGRLVSIGKASASLAQRLPQFLTAISMPVENALAQLEATSCPEGVKQELEAALRAASALAGGVEQVREFAKTGSRKSLVHRVDLRAVLVKVVRLLEVRARQTNTVIRIDKLDELPPVRMAEGDGEQLLFSLIENILRFSDGKKHDHVAVSAVANDQHIEFQFSGDCGLVPKEHLEGALDRLLTVEPADRAVSLGLCVAGDIVVRAGGRIWSEGAAGEGLTFFVTLPIADQVRTPME